MAQDAYSKRGLKGLKGLNKMRGLSALSDSERQAFYNSYSNVLKNYTGDALETKANTLYMNKVFKDTFGQEAFDKYNNNDEESFRLRNQMLKSKLVQDAWVQYASPIHIHNGKKYRDNNTGLGADYEKYSELSDDAKLELMQSDYLRPIDFDNKWKRDIERQKAIAKANANIISPMGFNIGGGVNSASDSMYNEATKQKAREKNQLILDKIYNNDIRHKENDDNVRAMVYSTYQKEFENMPADQVKKNFIKGITKDSYTNINGTPNLGVPEFQSHYGNGTDDEVTQEMSEYSIDDMKNFLARKKVYDQVFSPGMAQTMLNNEAKDYIYDRQNWFKRKWLQTKDFGIATMSYTADKINSIYTLGLAAEDALSKNKPQVYVNEDGEVLDPKTKFQMGAKGALLYKGDDGEIHTAHKIEVSRVALHNMGLNMDGSKDNSILSQDYWTKAEQYGLLSSKAQEKAAAIGSSPDQIPYGTDGEAGLAYESLKMLTFGIADQAAQLVPYGIGMAGNAISNASKAGKVVKGLGKAMDWTGKMLTAQSKTGSALQGTAGALGIANAYARGAFPETLQENLMNLEETVANESYNEVHQQYLTDKQYKAKVDQKIADRITLLRAALMSSKEHLSNINTAELYNQAQRAVVAEEISQRIAEKKSSQDYANMQEKAIQGASNTAMMTFLPEAVKYGLVNTMGFMKWRYTNPASLQKKTSKVFKGLQETTTKEGRKRLAQTTSKFLTNGAKWKELGKTTASQVWGGAWTNGTDDMMVDGAQRVNEDSYNRYLDAYRSGEALADTYGFADGVYSYWKGLSNSLGQATTANTTLVGGIGAIVSATPNFTNIASLMTKEGRKAYKNAYRMNARKDKDGNVTFTKANFGFKDKLNFFVQNGILNSYYAKKSAEATNVEHAEYINKILDQYNDFEALEGMTAADYAGQNYTDMGDEKTGEFLKALEAARAIKQLGVDNNDPSSLSSIILRNKQLTAALAAYNKNPEKNPLPEEVKENILSTYYAKNPGKVKSVEEDAKALNIVTKNAKTLQEAIDAYDASDAYIAKLEKSTKTTFDPQVKHQIKLNQALSSHWKEREKQMKSELGDPSSNVPSPTGETLLATVGGKENAQQLVTVYNQQANEFAEKIKAQQEKTSKAKEEVDTIKKEWEEAIDKGDSVKQIDTENRYKEVNAKYENEKAQEEYLEALQDATLTRRDNLSKALQEIVDINPHTQEIATIQAKIDKAQKEKESLKDNKDNLKKGSNAQKVQLEKVIAKLEKQKQALEESNTSQKDKVLTAEEIFNLDPVSRATMMNPDNRDLGLYSKEQQKEIEKLEMQLKAKDPDALTKVQDIAKLHQRAATADDAYNRLISYPEGAAYSYDAQRSLAAMSAGRLYNYKAAVSSSDFVKEIIKNFSEAKGNPSSSDLALLVNFIPNLKESVNSSNSPEQFVFNFYKRNAPTMIDEILKYDMLPEYTQPLKNAKEWGETMGMFQSIIDGSDKGTNWQRAASTDLDNIGKNATTKAEILSAFEKAIEDIKDNNSQKAEELRGLLKQYRDLEMQKNAVPVKEETSSEQSSKEEKEDSKETANTSTPTSPTEPTVAMQNEEDSLDLSKEVEESETSQENKEQKESPKENEENEERKIGENANEVTSEESSESTSQEGKDIYVQDNGDSVQAKVPTLEEMAEDAKRELPSELGKSVTIHNNDTVADADVTEATENEKVETKPNTLSGNAMAEYVYDILRRLKKLVHKKGNREGDAMNQYFDWMKAAGIKLQNIIDYELRGILDANPNAKVKFMAVKISDNATNDKAMQNHLMLVLDYDNNINKGITSLHNEDNGGVIESNGKKYLIIGTVGYGNKNPFKLAWYDILWNPYKKDGINLKRQRKLWFDEHPNERFFVPEEYSTEIVPGYPTPGYIVKQLEGEDSSKDRSIIELLESKRNPYGLKLSQIGWGIQMQKGFLTVNSLSEMMSLKDPEGNMGRAFALVPASNGKTVPLYFKVRKYTEIAEGKLKEHINEILDDLVNTSSKVRKEAIGKLYRYIYLSPEGDNIILKGSEITFVSNGEEIASFNLDKNFDRVAYKNAFEKLNPRINVTLNTFKNEASIREYAEAGALNTDAALLGTAGSSYMIYPLDKEGRMVKPIETEVPNTSTDTQRDFKNKRTQIIFNHEYYTVEDNKFFLNGTEVTDSKTIKQLSVLNTILDKDLNAAKTEGTWNYFIMETGESPKVVKVEKNSKEVRELSTEESKKIVEEIVKKKEEERKEKESQKALEEAKKIGTPDKVEDVDLGIEEDSVTIDPETGEVISETPVQPQETLQETSQLEGNQEVSKEESTKEVTNEEPLTPQVDGNTGPSTQTQKPLTQNFITLVKDKEYRNRILALVKKKWPTAGSKLSDIEKALEGHGIEITTIGTSKDAIEAWIKTIEDCR